MARFPSVCKGCKAPKRHINCHANCKEYLAAKAEHEALTAYERKEKLADEDAKSAIFKLAKMNKR